MMHYVRLKLIAVAAVIVAAGFLLYRNRILMENWFWHLRHGEEVAVGNYVIPVPRNWYPDQQETGALLMVRLDTEAPSKPQRLQAHASVMAMPRLAVSDDGVKGLISVELSALKEEGPEPAQRDFDAGGETISCLRRNKLGSMGIYDVDPTPWDCIVPGGLNVLVMMTGPDSKQVWEIVSHIRRKP